MATKLYRFKSRHGAAHTLVVPICDECVESREGAAKVVGAKGRTAPPLNSKLELVSEDAKGQECDHRYRIGGPIDAGWAAPKGAAQC